jgi:hypothetical protein
MKNLILLAFVLVFILSGCLPATQGDIEEVQQGDAVKAITKNQPVPDLGGYSLERQIIIETYLARNTTISTYAYMITMDGKIIEICPSIAYPIPYSTQLTNPEILTYNTVGGAGVIEGAIPNPEINSLYPPGDAAATLVQCVNPDGSVSPVYIEWYVLSFPYRIASDYQLQRIGEPSFTVDLGK